MALSPAVKRSIYAALALAAVVIVVLDFLPDPIEVEIQRVVRGPLQVTLNEDAETRAHDHYVVSAPAPGRIARIELHEGDAVRAGEAVARIFPAPLSAREREEYEARLEAAEARLREASKQADSARVAHEQAARELARAEALLRDGLVAPQAAEQARLAERTAADAVEASSFRVRAARADREAASAALIAVAGREGRGPSVVPVLSPIDGQVLRIPDRSERVVPAGEPLVVVGDPSRMEVVIDLLSSDAVSVSPGMPVSLEDWGGGRALAARVRAVEPLAYTKVSALGVEEQRVNVIADLIEPPGPLGDGYRVEAKLVLWSGEDLLKAPVSALFRHGDDWCVFVVDRGRARRRAVQPGHRGQLEVEILGGLSEGDLIVRTLSNDLEDGARVRVR